MRKVIKADQPFERSEMPIDEAIAWSKKTDQPYKDGAVERPEAGRHYRGQGPGHRTSWAPSPKAESKVDKVSFYTNGDFTDLCRGPHVASTGKAGAFKLMRVAGAYWRGDEKRPQMQRLYGVAFATEEELKKHLKHAGRGQARDHRKLGQELDLFVFSDMVGSGLPLFTPRGAVLREELAELLGGPAPEVRLP